MKKPSNLLSAVKKSKNRIRTAVFYSAAAALFAFMSLCFFVVDGKATEYFKTTPQDFHFPISDSFLDRIYKPSDSLISIMSKLDADYIKPDKPYTAYFPNESEIKSVNNAYSYLPERVRKVIDPQFLGIFFIRNFTGSGMAIDTTGSDNKTFYAYVANPTLLELNASEWITKKEKSAFILDDPTMDIKIDIGTEDRGFYYILLHEMAHIYDYNRIVTPLGQLDPLAKDYVANVKAGKSESDKFPFDGGIWKEHNIPVKDYDFYGRSAVTYYGLNKGPKIKISNAVLMYSQLEKTPFVTLYGAQNWQEDFAEVFAAYVHTQILKRQWTLTVFKNGKPVYKYKIDFSRKLLKKRAAFIDNILSGKCPDQNKDFPWKGCLEKK